MCCVCVVLLVGLGEGGILIGLDLVKDVCVLEVVYDDVIGVMVVFNFNVFNYVNVLVGIDFVLCDWCYVVFYNVC